MELKDLLGDAYSEGMTLEDVQNALKGRDLVDRATATEGMVAKSLLDKATSEAAGYKKQLRERQTAEERERADREAASAADKAELERLRAEVAVNTRAKQYMALGFAEDLATDTAQALVKGDFDRVFANHKSFLEQRDRAAEVARVNSNDKRPPAGAASRAPDFANMAQEAQKRGDYTAVAYYTRLAQQDHTD